MSLASFDDFSPWSRNEISGGRIISHVPLACKDVHLSHFRIFMRMNSHFYANELKKKKKKKKKKNESHFCDSIVNLPKLCDKFANSSSGKPTTGQ